jgi:IS30 family transposase
MVRRLRVKDLKPDEIARDLNFTAEAIRLTARDDRSEDGTLGEWTPADRGLSAEEREVILVGLRDDGSMSSIARHLGRVPSTIVREVAANVGAANSEARRAHCRARCAVRRPKPAKLDHPMLVSEVTKWLEPLQGPQEISLRFRLEFPVDLMMQVSHETIYQSLFVHGPGELRRELVRCLRSGRTQWRSQDLTEWLTSSRTSRPHTCCCSDFSSP